MIVEFPPSMCAAVRTRPVAHEWRAIEVADHVGLIHGIEIEVCDRCRATRTTTYDLDGVGRAIVIRHTGDAS